jgi:hypothetical protein
VLRKNPGLRRLRFYIELVSLIVSLSVLHAAAAAAAAATLTLKSLKAALVR